LANDADAFDQFGYSVSLFNNHFLMGANYHSHGNSQWSGAAYEYNKPCNPDSQGIVAIFCNGFD
jgi:hypothetical protein